jgi:hypothetical protein
MWVHAIEQYPMEQYLPIEKDEELLRFFVLFSSQELLLRAQKLFLFLSICRRFARLDIFAVLRNIFAKQQIRYVFATLKLDMT